MECQKIQGNLQLHEVCQIKLQCSEMKNWEQTDNSIGSFVVEKVLKTYQGNFLKVNSL